MDVIGVDCTRVFQLTQSTGRKVYFNRGIFVRKWMNSFHLKSIMKLLGHPLWMFSSESELLFVYLSDGTLLEIQFSVKLKASFLYYTPRTPFRKVSTKNLHHRAAPVFFFKEE